MSGTIKGYYQELQSYSSVTQCNSDLGEDRVISEIWITFCLKPEHRVWRADRES